MKNLETLKSFLLISTIVIIAIFTEETHSKSFDGNSSSSLARQKRDYSKNGVTVKCKRSNTGILSKTIPMQISKIVYCEKPWT